MRFKWLLMIVLVCGFIGVMGIQAQDREATRPFERFTAGGRGDNLVYYTPDLPDYPRLIRIINESITVFDTMTPVPWNSQIVVVFMGASVPDLYVIGRMLNPMDAYVTRLEPQTLFPTGDVCYLRVLNGWEGSENIESQVAKQLFFCLQMSIGASAIQDYSDPTNAWWLLASAEWAASRVYPRQFPQPIHSTFDFKRDVTTNRLDNFYFWEFLASSQGMMNVQNVIQQMGVIRQSGTFPLNYGFDPTDLFHNWANVLLNRRLPINPALDLSDIDITAGKSGSLVTALPRFSVDYKTLVAFEVEPGNVAFIKITDSATSNYAVSLRVSGGLKRLIDGEPMKLCPSEVGEMLIISRGRGEKDASPVPFTIEWGQMESDKPCKPKGEELADDNVECIVGSWQVVSYPTSQADSGSLSIDTSKFIFTFSTDGIITGMYDVTIPMDTGEVNASIPFLGTYQISQATTTEAGTSFDVQEFSWVLQKGGSATMTINDEDQDITEMIYKNSPNTDAWLPNGSLICDNDTLSWVTNEGIGSFELIRMP